MHPDIPSRAERYLDLAGQGENRWWRYGLGLILVALASLGVIVLVMGTSDMLVATGMISRTLAERIARIVAGHDDDSSIISFVIANLTIIAMIAGLAIAMKLLHRRSMLSLVTSEGAVDRHRVLQGAGVMLLLLAGSTLVEQLLFPGRYRVVFDPARFFVFLPVVLMLTPLQTLAEELVFRGYIMQGLGRVIRGPVAVAILSSIVFAALHMWNPEVERHGMMLMAANYFVMGMLLATITLRDGRLELAIGVHAINNLFAALISNNEGSALRTESIFLSPFDPMFSLIATPLIAVIFHWWVFDRASVRRLG